MNYNAPSLNCIAMAVNPHFGRLAFEENNLPAYDDQDIVEELCQSTLDHLYQAKVSRQLFNRVSELMVHRCCGGNYVDACDAVEEYADANFVRALKIDPSDPDAYWQQSDVRRISPNLDMGEYGAYLIATHNTLSRSSDSRICGDLINWRTKNETVEQLVSVMHEDCGDDKPRIIRMKIHQSISGESTKMCYLEVDYGRGFTRLFDCSSYIWGRLNHYDMVLLLAHILEETRDYWDPKAIITGISTIRLS